MENVENLGCNGCSNEEVADALQTRLTACENELRKERQDKEMYNKWWQEETAKRIRLEKTINALHTLLSVVAE